MRGSQLLDRFLDRLSVVESGCWEWTGSIITGGYGCVWFQGGVIRAHRLSHEMFRGPIPSGMLVCHKCDNRICVNPYHLFLGSYKDNARDMCRKGRHYLQVDQSSVRGEKCRFSKLNPSDVLAIKARLRSGEAYAPIAGDFGVHSVTIGEIARGETWAHVTLEGSYNNG